MSGHGKCCVCNRRFRSKEARELAEAYRATHERLRMEVEIDRQPDKPARHKTVSAEYRQNG